MPLDYIKDDNAKDRREHVHYVETLADQDVADRLTLLRLSDADHLEEVRSPLFPNFGQMWLMSQLYIYCANLIR
ncbi:Hypothetical protein PHPALM_8913 [Phytophthora palmivora]|uniref:Uncharacterized protein n=1 Tax=Phytophthora palmivora TaxID=4796 RepID=A0A2P4Y8N3_9STRA|nr:Hypothetical protein PHPALM_8913 [Phytophthora palmivora]